jgi:hypothetical protein
MQKIILVSLFIILALAIGTVVSLRPESGSQSPAVQITEHPLEKSATLEQDLLLLPRSSSESQIQITQDFRWLSLDDLQTMTDAEIKTYLNNVHMHLAGTEHSMVDFQVDWNNWKQGDDPYLENIEFRELHKALKTLLESDQKYLELNQSINIERWVMKLTDLPENESASSQWILDNLNLLQFDDNLQKYRL